MHAALLVILLMLIAGCVHQPKSTNDFERELAGHTLHFRANLTEAAAVPVYPDAGALRELLLNPDLLAIKIAFIPNETENEFYAVTGYELSYKLTAILRAKYDRAIPISAMVLEGEPETKASTAIIWMRGPSLASETAIRVKNNIIFVDGAVLTEVSKKYTDLDLAADKLLLVMLG